MMVKMKCIVMIFFLICMCKQVLGTFTENQLLKETEKENLFGNVAVIQRQEYDHELSSTNSPSNRSTEDTEVFVTRKSYGKQKQKKKHKKNHKDDKDGVKDPRGIKYGTAYRIAKMEKNIKKDQQKIGRAIQRESQKKSKELGNMNDQEYATNENEDDVEKVKKVNGSKFVKVYKKLYLVIWDVDDDYTGVKETWEPKENINFGDVQEFEDKKEKFIVQSIDKITPDRTTCKSIKQFRVTWKNPEDSSDLFETWEKETFVKTYEQKQKE